LNDKYDNDVISITSVVMLSGGYAMPSQRMSESVQPLKDRIDELKRIQDDLRIKEFAIASSINGIAIGNLEGVITYVNRAAVKMWGGTDPAEIIGKPVTVFA